MPLRWGGSVGADYVSQENGDSADWYQGQFYLAGPVVAEKPGLQFWGRTNAVYVTNKARGLPRSAPAVTQVPVDPAGDTVTLIRP
ncbi:MAG: hypothetical protein WC597_13630 [Brevundimonas sp.]